VIHSARVEPVDNVLRDLDWKTLIFLAAIFALVQAFTKTGLLQGMSLQLYSWFGAEITQVALVMLAGIGLLSSLLANIPVVAASLIMAKGLSGGRPGSSPEFALAPSFTDWPAATLPLFIAMMFGATLGGNATLIGASANIVSVGICNSQGAHVTFLRFARYGVPITLAQLTMGALYVLALTSLLGAELPQPQWRRSCHETCPPPAHPAPSGSDPGPAGHGLCQHPGRRVRRHPRQWHRCHRQRSSPPDQKWLSE
jgi:Na+/H+ antiporter NhaD/arsenite permease-like protein